MKILKLSTLLIILGIINSCSHGEFEGTIWDNSNGPTKEHCFTINSLSSTYVPHIYQCFKKHSSSGLCSIMDLFNLPETSFETKDDWLQGSLKVTFTDHYNTSNVITKDYYASDLLVDQNSGNCYLKIELHEGVTYDATVEYTSGCFECYDHNDGSAARTLFKETKTIDMIESDPMSATQFNLEEILYSTSPC